MLRIRGLTLEINEDFADLRQKVSKMLRTNDFRMKIERESIDARKPRNNRPQNIRFQYSVLIETEQEEALSRIKGVEPAESKSLVFAHGTETLRNRPLIVGFGPAGLFAAYILAKEGYRPIVWERGDSIDERKQKVDAFWDGTAGLDPDSNVQFGEGGAGTFSDGKLTSRSKDPLGALVLETFVRHGAPPEIEYSFQPHIGTDLLREVIRSMREQILKWGGEIRFTTPLTDLAIEGGAVSRVFTREETASGPVLLGIGHSARDTFRLLTDKGVAASAKAFAVGCRIEHPQGFIDQMQYGVFAGHPRLGAASYSLHSPNVNDRNCWSFCMCPGGLVVAAASEEGRLVTNGMSYHARDLENANSAILTGVVPGRDFGTEILAGVRFQESLEEEAFRLGGGKYFAPVQSVPDFLRTFGLSGNGSGKVEPSYRPGVKEARLTELFSEEVGGALAQGLATLGKRLPGFAGSGAVLTGVESRSSSPVRFTRDPQTRESVNTAGLYPIGEGAGYAGGIVSAAVDGLRTAEALMLRFAPPQ